MKYISKFISTFTPLIVFALTMLCIYMGTTFQNKARAGVYVSDQIDATSAFCQAVATTKDVYCPRVRVDCRMVKKKLAANFMKVARKCAEDPGAIKEADAAKLMQNYQQYQSALCCMPLRK